MPYLQLDLPVSVAPAVRLGLADALARTYAEVMATNRQRVTVSFRELGENGVLRDGAQGTAPALVVSCDVRRGRASESRRQLGDRLAALLHDVLEWPPGRVVVYFTEHAGDEIYFDGELMDDWTPAEVSRQR